MVGATTHYAVAAVGKNRFFWCVWSPERWEGLFSTDVDAPSDPVEKGYCRSKAEAVAAARQAAGEHSKAASGIYARSRHRYDAKARRVARATAKPSNANGVQPVEFVYHDLQDYNEVGHFVGFKLCAHRIFKRTAKRVFVQRSCSYQTESESTYAIDRAKLEASGEHFVPNWGPLFRLTPECPQRDARERIAPPCVAALGLSWPCTKQDVDRAYRRLARSRHPDAGGTAEAFVELTRARDQALNLALVEVSR